MSYRFKKRKFLNRDETKSAHIIAVVENTEFGENGQLWGANAFLDIVDCNRKATLEFYMDSKKDAEKALKKVDLILELITEFKAALEHEAEIIASYKNPKKETDNTNG